jgi:hypothetical protein
MLSTALLIGAGLVIVGNGMLALKSRLRRRMDRSTLSPDEAARARAGALQQLARDMDKDKASRSWQEGMSVFGP